MSRKIKVTLKNEETLEETLRRNLLKARLSETDECNTYADTEPVDEHGPEDVYMENVGAANASPKKDITLTEVINHENDSIKPEVIQMRKELSPDQVSHIVDLAKNVIKFNQRIEKVENTKEDAKAARILINQENNVNTGLTKTTETRTNINKENKEDIKRFCIKAKNILSDKSFDNTYAKYEKHYGDVSTGEFLMDIPKENLESVDKYENVNHPEHYNNYDVEAIEMMERIWGPEETAIFCKLNAFKYRMRMGTKPTSPIEEDIKKEKWYIKKYHELLNKLKIK